jgi:large subunit ribosomal protein L30
VRSMIATNSHKCVAAIRLRGTVRENPDIATTLTSFRLKKKYNAILIHQTPNTTKMLQKAKDFITWGEVDPETITLLLESRGYTIGGNRFNKDYLKRKFPNYGSIHDLAKDIVKGTINLDILWKGRVKPVFRLHPPKGGFRGKTKRAFKDKGELGYRGEEIKSLLRKMI